MKTYKATRHAWMVAVRGTKKLTAAKKEYEAAAAGKDDYK